MRLPSSIAVLVASIAQAQAQYLVTELSFGHGVRADAYIRSHRISPEGTPTIPNFSLQGNPNPPELLSNKLILTPPAPGNQRGAVWSDSTLKNQNWILDVDFRANGPERGGGNLNIWVVRDGVHDVGSASIYTAGRFEGLALVIDGHGGYGGMLRAFLNDGSTDYRQQHNVDQLSFGHCSVIYRNLGRPSQLKLRHSDSSFKVEIDGHLCFESDKVRIPEGYHIGITAASADNPDSFEVFKLVTLTENTNDRRGQQAATENAIPNDGPGTPERADGQHVVYGKAGFRVGDNAGATSQNNNYNNKEPHWDAEIPDAEADKITSSKAQFADLHNRLQSVNHHLSTIFRTIATNVQTGEHRHEEMSVMMGELKGLLTSRVLDKLEKLDALEGKIAGLEREVKSVRNELAQKMRETEHAVKSVVTDKHETLADHIKANAAPGHTRLIVAIFGSQLVLVGLFVLYKRRKASGPKKYL
ncbi:concanavalin A-like lectin/glucanase domain-containing protein [Coniochaeta sp. 2T2.1]|nr:concanavalin A-like lectin/glucanase domain-containing protein [Coniochaeta sp. 2T2.1]